MWKTFIAESCSRKAAVGEPKGDENWGAAANHLESSWAASVLLEHMKQDYKWTLKMSTQSLSTFPKPYCLQNLKYHVEGTNSSEDTSHQFHSLLHNDFMHLQFSATASSSHFCMKGCTFTKIINISQVCDEGNRYLELSSRRRTWCIF